MKKHIEIGRIQRQAYGKPVFGPLMLDLHRLIETRLLIQASSGGGKSMALRKIQEATHGHAPQIIFDREGEFSTLREKYDYVLAGKGGDIPVNASTAVMLAKYALELNINLIVDLYELSHAERHRVVRIMFESMINAPKNLWGPRLVVLDEAHEFCPEKGAGSSEAAPAVIDMAEKGRKRGLGLILASQRISNLSKDAAAQCQNKLIGLCNIHLDRKRAGEELGMNSKDEIIVLRDMEPGSFFAIGPALTRQVTKVQVNMAETSHAKAGNRAKAKPPAPSAKVKAVLAKLTDLPKEAAEEAKTMADLQTRVRTLMHELAKAKKQTVAIENPSADLLAMKKKYERQVEKITFEMDHRRIQDIRENMGVIRNSLNKALTDSFKELPAMTPMKPMAPEVSGSFIGNAKIEQKSKNQMTSGEYLVLLKAKKKPIENADSDATMDVPLTKCEKEIIYFLKGFGHCATKIQVAVGSGYSVNSGGFNNALSHLRTLGFLDGRSDKLVLTETVPELEPRVQQPPLELILSNLSKCEREIFNILKVSDESGLDKENLAKLTPSNYSPTSGGFNNAIAHLISLGMAKRISGSIALNPDVFELIA